MVKSKSIWSDQNHFGPTKTVLVTKKDKASVHSNSFFQNKIWLLQIGPQMEGIIDSIKTGCRLKNVHVSQFQNPLKTKLLNYIFLSARAKLEKTKHNRRPCMQLLIDNQLQQKFLGDADEINSSSTYSKTALGAKSKFISYLDFRRIMARNFHGNFSGSIGSRWQFKQVYIFH